MSIVFLGSSRGFTSKHIKLCPLRKLDEEKKILLANYMNLKYNGNTTQGLIDI
jgi:hypothetical protein